MILVAAALGILPLACGGSSSTGKQASTDAGNDAGVDAANVDCDGTVCEVGQACVVTTSSGGACELPDDAGVCPSGQTGVPGQCCDNTTVTYACQPLPPECNGQLACPCATSLCPCGDCLISASGRLECECLYP